MRLQQEERGGISWVHQTRQKNAQRQVSITDVKNGTNKKNCMRTCQKGGGKKQSGKKPRIMGKINMEREKKQKFIRG